MYSRCVGIHFLKLLPTSQCMCLFLRHHYDEIKCRRLLECSVVLRILQQLHWIHNGSSPILCIIQKVCCEFGTFFCNIENSPLLYSKKLCHFIWCDISIFLTITSFSSRAIRFSSYIFLRFRLILCIHHFPFFHTFCSSSISSDYNYSSAKHTIFHRISLKSWIIIIFFSNKMLWLAIQVVIFIIMFVKSFNINLFSNRKQQNWIEKNDEVLKGIGVNHKWLMSRQWSCFSCVCNFY